METASDASEAYDVDVERAAQILGVGKTRLSQLTSAGILSFERRKVGVRNRLFYRRSELQAHLQRHYPQPQASAFSESLPQSSPLPCSEPRIVRSPSTSPRTPRAPRPSALACRNEREKSLQLAGIRAMLESVTQELRLLRLRLAAVERRDHQIRHAKGKTIAKAPTPSQPPAPDPITAADRRRARIEGEANASTLRLRRQELHTQSLHQKNRQPTSTLPESPHLSRKRKEEK